MLFFDKKIIILSLDFSEFAFVFLLRDLFAVDSAAVGFDGSTFVTAFICTNSVKPE